MAPDSPTGDGEPAHAATPPALASHREGRHPKGRVRIFFQIFFQRRSCRGGGSQAPGGGLSLGRRCGARERSNPISSNRWITNCTVPTSAATSRAIIGVAVPPADASTIKARDRSEPGDIGQL
jgi:hypothetical protein